MAGYRKCLMLIVCILLSGCRAVPAKTPPSSITLENTDSSEDALRLAMATDLHYQPEVSDTTSSLVPQMKEIDALVSCLLSETAVQQADALLLCGDLTNNGQLREHLALIDKLDTARRQGTQILVIPGNHDLSGISREEFALLYKDYGYESPFMADADSLSYVHRLTDRFWLLMMDTNTGGGVSDDTLLWANHVLGEAESVGALVVSASHHNLLGHSSAQYSKLASFKNQEALLNLYLKHKVPMNINGHLHKQHAAKTDSSSTVFYEITGGMLADYPNLYSLFTVSPETKQISYQSQSLDVDGWASRQGYQEERLLHFSEYSRSCRQKSAPGLIGGMLSSMDISSDITASKLERLTNFWTNVYMDASDGTIRHTRSAYLDSDDYRLWLLYRNQSKYSEWLDFLLGHDGTLDSHSLQITY